MVSPPRQGRESDAGLEEALGNRLMDLRRPWAWCHRCRVDLAAPTVRVHDQRGEQAGAVEVEVE